MDTLQELSVEQWPMLQEKLTTQWPLNAGGYYALYVNLKHAALRDAFHFKVYCPYGDMDYGLVATTIKDDVEYIFFPVNEDTSKLEEALQKTKIINWDSKVLVDMTSSTVVRIMENLNKKMAFKNFQVWGAKMFFLNKTSQPFSDVQCPPDTFLAPVNQDDIKQVDDAWPYRHSCSQSYFSTLISNGLSYGLYSNDNKLLAWVFLNEYHFLCNLYCETSSRRKGYGEFIIKSVVNDCLRQGIDVYGYVVPGNQKAVELFTKLGFEMVDDAAWTVINGKDTY